MRNWCISKRIEFICKLCELGYQNQIVMSMDITRQSHLKKNGGIGYSYLIENFIPKLVESGLQEEMIELIMCKNFERILNQ